MFLLPLFWASLGVGARAQTVNCTVDYATINFGFNIDILSDRPISGEGYATVSCPLLTFGQSARVCVGMHPDTSPSRMENQSYPSTFLYYDIFTDREHTQPWYDPLRRRPFVDVTSTQTTVRMDAFAVIPSGQTMSSAGRYSEFIQPPFRYFVYSTGDTPPTCDQQGYNRTPSYLAVVATITPNCTISATNMTFPPQTIITKDLLAQSALTVKCTNDPANPIIPYISLDDGLHATAGQRQMENTDKPGNFISYDLYSDSQRSSPWGSSFGVNTVPITRSANNTSVPVYGKIPKPTISPPAGPYTDRVTVTVNF